MTQSGAYSLKPQCLVAMVFLVSLSVEANLFLSSEHVFLLHNSVLLMLVLLETAATVRFIKRMRWVLLSIAFLWLLQTPGEPMWASFYAPTWAGLRLAWSHVVAVLLASLLIQVILRCYAQNELIYALYQLACPWRIFGCSAARIAVRLGLMFEALQAFNQPNQGLRTLLSTFDAANHHDDPLVSIDLPQARWSLGDSVLVGLAAIAWAIPYAWRVVTGVV